MTEPVAPTMENIALTLDNGAVLDFRGRLFSEASWFDEDSGVLTHQKLYSTEGNEQVYSVVSGTGKTRSRRAYRIAVQGDTCSVTDGWQFVLCAGWRKMPRPLWNWWKKLYAQPTADTRHFPIHTHILRAAARSPLFVIRQVSLSVGDTVPSEERPAVYQRRKG